MKFSVIIPAYNAEKTIKRCLQSVLAQNFHDFEVLILNDGSTDKTSDICSEFKTRDSRIRYFYHDNRGVSFTRNKGILEANGDFIVFLDCDDTYEPNYLYEFSSIIDQYPNYDNYWCCYNVYDANSKLLQKNTLKTTTDNFVFSSKKNIMTWHIATLDAALWNKAFRRSIIIENAIFMKEDLSLGEDLLFNYAYLNVANDDIIILNSPNYRYIKANSDSLDSKFRSDLKEIFDILNNTMYNYISNWNLDEQQLQMFRNRVFYSYEKVLYNTYRPENSMSDSEKRKYNRRILKSEDFKKAFANTRQYIHPLYRLGYQISSWGFIRFLNFLIDLRTKNSR